MTAWACPAMLLLMD